MLEFLWETVEEGIKRPKEVCVLTHQGHRDLASEKVPASHKTFSDISPL